VRGGLPDAVHAHPGDVVGGVTDEARVGPQPVRVGRFLARVGATGLVVVVVAKTACRRAPVRRCHVVGFVFEVSPPSCGATDTATAATEVAAAGVTSALTWGGGRLYRHGAPHRILSGALHYFDGTLAGVADPESPELRLDGIGDVVRLEILVENLGRVNYGPGIGGHKGLLGPVLVDRRSVQGWESTPVALQEWSAEELAAAVAAGPETSRGAGPVSAGAGFAVAELHVATPADTFLALPGSSRGLVWVNGFLLGRYREIGPQVTLYCPAPLLRAGVNTLTVLELERRGGELELRDRPELGPPQEYVEEFD
jgi:beta-galactosidase